MHIVKYLQNRRDRLRRKMHNRLVKLQARLRPVVLKNDGFCPICERDTTFVSRDVWLRDHYKCCRCGSIPRERALMLVIERRFPNWRELTIHESSPGNRGVSKRFAQECRSYIPSHFYPDRALGSLVDGYRCENLEELSFDDATIDLHVTQDVFEHVIRPARAFSEVARTLKPGGAHVFTMPLVNKEKPSAKRVEVDSSGVIHFLQPPEYHGNPIDSNGSLVTMDWGYDVRAYIAAACGLETEIIYIDDLSKGIRAEYIEVLVTTKPSSTRADSRCPPLA